jgi:hypothetical protein
MNAASGTSSPSTSRPVAIAVSLTLSGKGAVPVEVMATSRPCAWSTSSVAVISSPGSSPSSSDAGATV